MRASTFLAPLAFAGCSFLALLPSGCSSRAGDPPANDGVPPPGGKDQRIADIVNPNAPGHAGTINTTQAVSGAIVIAIDTYDETGDGKSIGDILMQDIGATPATPYAGIGIFAPTFNPGNLKVSPGDVIDMVGEYQESAGFTATTQFPPGSVLAQLYQPTVTFRYETQVPQPIDIDINDLSDFTKGQRWIGMLVRIKNPTAAAALYTAASGRQSFDLSVISGAGTSCNSPFPRPASVVNSLMDLTPVNIAAGSKWKSIVGVVGFFCSLQISPRTAADFQN